MKLFFICGCLEPGRDGIGDYTTLLAKELVIAGHECYILALMDKFVDSDIFEKKSILNISIDILRLPYKEGIKKNSIKSKKWLEKINPTLVSIQYVPFAYQNKGLPFFLSYYLEPLIQGKNVEIMFHELWLGMFKKSTFKRLCWGFTQKILIIVFIKNIRPLIVHTQSKLYLEKLKKININALMLPLFSNIPKVSDRIQHESMEQISLVFFGTIHPDADFDALILIINEYHNLKKGFIVVKIVGRSGNEFGYFLEIMNQNNIKVINFGEISDIEVSNILSSSTIGISTAAEIMLDKSSSLAAMQAHKLPVICIGSKLKAWNIESISLPYGVFTLSKSVFEKCINFQYDTKIAEVNIVAEKFIKDVKILPSRDA